MGLYYIVFSADKELVDGSNEDKWSFDGTVRHLPQGVVPGENGPVPVMPVTPQEQQQQTSTPSSLSSTEQLPAQQQQQNNHIEQVKIVTIFVN